MKFHNLAARSCFHFPASALNPLGCYLCTLLLHSLDLPKTNSVRAVREPARPAWTSGTRQARLRREVSLWSSCVCQCGCLKDEQSYFASIKTQLKAQKLSFRERNSQKQRQVSLEAKLFLFFFVNQCHCNVKNINFALKLQFYGQAR